MFLEFVHLIVSSQFCYRRCYRCIDAKSKGYSSNLVLNHACYRYIDVESSSYSQASLLTKQLKNAAMSLSMNPLQGQDMHIQVTTRQSRQSMVMADAHHASGKMETMHQGQREVKQRNEGMTIIQVEETFFSLLGYLVENRIASNPSFPFVVIIVIFLVFYIIFGLLWYLVGKDSNDVDGLYGADNSNDAFFLALQMLSTGGYTDEIPLKHGYRYLYFLMIFIGPTIIFAILIGFINDGITSFMDRLKDGKTAVHEQNHTLILGWNEATARVIVQASFLRRQYQMLNEQKFWILRWFPLFRIPLNWLNLLERPSTSIAARAPN